MLTGPEELTRLRARDSLPPQPGDGFVEKLMIDADNPGAVVNRARSVLEAVLAGSASNLEPGSHQGRDLLPDWFTSACRPEPTADERNRWLDHWRGQDRKGKAQAEAEWGWTLIDWLHAIDHSERSWRWWAADRRSVLIVVDGWPASVEPLVWLLGVAGARRVETSTVGP